MLRATINIICPEQYNNTEKGALKGSNSDIHKSNYLQAHGVAEDLQRFAYMPSVTSTHDVSLCQHESNNPVSQLEVFPPLGSYSCFFKLFIYFQSPNDLRPAIADALCFLLLPQRARSQAAFPLPTCHKSQHPVRKACRSLTYHLPAD